MVSRESVSSHVRVEKCRLPRYSQVGPMDAPCVCSQSPLQTLSWNKEVNIEVVARSYKTNTFTHMCNQTEDRRPPGVEMRDTDMRVSLDMCRPSWIGEGVDAVFRPSLSEEGMQEAATLPCPLTVSEFLAKTSAPLSFHQTSTFYQTASFQAAVRHLSPNSAFLQDCSPPLNSPRSVSPTVRAGIVQSFRAFMNRSPQRIQPAAAARAVREKVPGGAAVSIPPVVEMQDLDPTTVMIGCQFSAGRAGTLYFGEFRGQQVAIKVFKNVSCDPEEGALLRRQFQQEVRVLSRLRHPNIVQFLGACNSQGPMSCLVMEYLGGGTVRKVLSAMKQPMPLQRVLEMALDTARGMKYLHSQGIIHRDLKSDNLIMDAAGKVKIVDFGVSRVMSDSTDEMTAEMGTYRWMAPEVMGSQTYCSKVDVYSFGIVLWELWTRDLPFTGMTPLQAAYAVLNKNLRPPIPSGCPRQLACLMQLCWQSDPESRPTFGQVVIALEGLLAQKQQQ